MDRSKKVRRRATDPKTVFVVGYELRPGEFQPAFGPHIDLHICRGCSPTPSQASVACIMAVTRIGDRDQYEKLFRWDVGENSWVLAVRGLDTRRVPAEKAKAADVEPPDDLVLQPLISLEYEYDDQRSRLDTIAMPSAPVAAEYVDRITAYVKARYPAMADHLIVYQVGALAMNEQEIFSLVDQIAEDNLVSPGDSLLKGANGQTKED